MTIRLSRVRTKPERAAIRSGIKDIKDGDASFGRIPVFLRSGRPLSDPQRDREAAALADLALDEYPAVVRIDELLGDGQSEAASLRLRPRHAEIAVENALMITRVYAATEILNIDIDPVVMLLGAHDDTGIFGRVVDRVG